MWNEHSCRPTGCPAWLVHDYTKEPNYFSDDAVFARGSAWYESLFDAAAPSELKGEASTHYTKLPTYPQALPRMAALLVAPKFVYLIRNPIERAISHYMHEWTMGKMAEDIGSAFDRYPELVAYSCYGRQIAPYIAHYGAECVLPITLEEMERAPQAILEKICIFLGYPGSPLWREEQARVNVSTDRIRRLPLHRLLVGNSTATTIRRALVPQGLRDWIKHSRQIHDRPRLQPNRIAALEGIFAEDHKVLRTLFPDKPELNSSYPFLVR